MRTLRSISSRDQHPADADKFQPKLVQEVPASARPSSAIACTQFFDETIHPHRYTGLIIGGFRPNSLPAKGLARALAAVSIAGCALSVCVHLIVLLGFHSKAILSFQVGLFLGIFPLGIPAFLAQERLLARWSFRERVGNSWATQKALLAKAPERLRWTFFALGYYAMAAFVVFLCRNFSTKVPSERDELWILSAYAAAFYSGFATMLMSYARSERPLRPEEI